MSPPSKPRLCQRPTRAIVLAAGLGTRLHPLTATMPKALVPFAGAPLLLRSIRLLKSWGVKEILINAHAHGEQIMAFCRDHSSAECRLTCSFEPAVLGTGGALKRAAWFFKEGEALWLLNADIVADLDAAPLRAALADPDCLAALWMVPDAGPLSVDCAQGRVVNFRSGNPGGEGTATFSGLHLLRPEILNFLPATEVFSSIVPAYEKAMKAGRTIAAVSVSPSFWADVGTPEQYFDALAAWQIHGGKPTGSLQWIDPTARIEKGAKVTESVVMRNAEIRRHAMVHRAIVAPGTVVDQHGTRLLAPMPQTVELVERDALDRLGLGGDTCCAECLSPRGSARQFIRVSDGRASALLVRYDPARKENTLYAKQARLLKQVGLPVFEVLKDHAQPPFLVVEDLGRVSLLDKTSDAPPALRMAWYQRAVSLIHNFHSRTARRPIRHKLPLMPPFTMRMYGVEHDLFLREFLTRWGEAGDAGLLLPELRSVAHRLTRLPRVVVHRDYQSTNLMVHQRKLWLIDFQGMRKGPAVHDVASLLFDPYIMLSQSEVERLFTYYLRLSGHPDAQDEDFHLAGIQRLIQALGAFGRLSQISGCEHFEQHIPAALERLDWCVNRTERAPQLAAWVTRMRSSVHSE